MGQALTLEATEKKNCPKSVQNKAIECNRAKGQVRGQRRTKKLLQSTSIAVAGWQVMDKKSSTLQCCCREGLVMDNPPRFMAFKVFHSAYHHPPPNFLSRMAFHWPKSSIPIFQQFFHSPSPLSNKETVLPLRHIEREPVQQRNQGRMCQVLWESVSEQLSCNCGAVWWTWG